jgi:hypothetical protein
VGAGPFEVERGSFVAGMVSHLTGAPPSAVAWSVDRTLDPRDSGVYPDYHFPIACALAYL